MNDNNFLLVAISITLFHTFILNSSLMCAVKITLSKKGNETIQREIAVIYANERLRSIGI